MLMQYKNPKALIDQYWGLRDNVQYRVVGISTSLDDYPGQLNHGVCHAIIVDRFGHNDKGEPIGRANFVPFDWLEIIDYTYPEDWESGIIHGNINPPALVFGFKELLNINFYVRIHDLNEEDGDNELLLKRLDEYGGNVKLSENETTTRNIYITAERTISGILAGIFCNPSDYKEPLRKYIGLLRTAVSARLKMISMTKDPTQKRILAENAAKYFYGAHKMSEYGIEIPEKLKDIWLDSDDYEKLPSDLAATLVDRAEGGDWDV